MCHSFFLLKKTTKKYQYCSTNEGDEEEKRGGMTEGAWKEVWKEEEGEQWMGETGKL